MSYIKFNIPEKVKEQLKKTLNIIAEAKDSKIRKGMNEVTKAIEREQAKLVVMAEDVNPPEILYHIPLLCDEKNIPYAYISSKKKLGDAVNIKVSASAIAIDKVGSGNDNVLKDIVKKLEELKK